MTIAGPGVDQGRDGEERVCVGVSPAPSKWKGLGRAPAVRSEEPWQVCVAGTGTALGSPHPSLHKGFQQKAMLTQGFWALPWHFPSQLLLQGVGWWGGATLWLWSSVTSVGGTLLFIGLSREALPPLA